MEEVETAAQFWTEFNIQLSALRGNLNDLRMLSADGCGDYSTNGAATSITRIKESHSKLQAFATVSTAVLPLYDIRRAQEVCFFLELLSRWDNSSIQYPIQN